MGWTETELKTMTFTQSLNPPIGAYNVLILS